jgi:Zn-dependent protease with chaperone function
MYFIRGATLALAAFFLLNTCFSLAARLLLFFLVRRGAWPLRPSAPLLFLSRVFPFCAAALSTTLLVIPSYLSLEPRSTGENMGWLLPLIATLSVWLLAFAWFEAIGSWCDNRVILREWLRRSEAISLPGVDIPSYRLHETFPVVAVIGALRPRLFISEQVLDALNAEELSAALQHEIGHLVARDNLKRWLAEMCPQVFPFGAGSRRLERVWHTATEQWADRYAVERGKAAPLNLASALIKVSRLVPEDHQRAIPAGAYLMEQQDVPEIARRVHALLDAADSKVVASPCGTVLTPPLVGAFILSALVLLAASYASVLTGVHEVLEQLLRLVS